MRMKMRSKQKLTMILNQQTYSFFLTYSQLIMLITLDHYLHFFLYLEKSRELKELRYLVIFFGKRKKEKEIKQKKKNTTKDSQSFTKDAISFFFFFFSFFFHGRARSYANDTKYLTFRARHLDMTRRKTETLKKVTTFQQVKYHGRKRFPQ